MNQPILDDIIVLMRIQNIHLLKYIAFCEGWNYTDLCKKYLL
jgi:hypothetical protein